MSNKLLSVPSGWKKGEPLLVDKRVVHGKAEWIVMQQVDFDVRSKEKIPVDAVAAIWMYTWSEFVEFLRWWYT